MAKDNDKKTNIDEDAPTCSMGGSSSSSGALVTFDPILTKKPITKRKLIKGFKEFNSNDGRSIIKH